jgi:hypothetical protein
MRRTRSVGGEKAYDASTHLNIIERELATILYIAGVEFNQISDVSIDDIFFKLRNSFAMTTASSSTQSTASYDITRKQNFLLTQRARHLWFERQIALAAEAHNG